MHEFNRLKVLCSIFGWNGGTIHQVQNTAESVIQDGKIDVLGLSDQEFGDLCLKLRALYPSYKQYIAEGHQP